MDRKDLGVRETSDAAETQAFGQWIGERLQIGDVLLLHGDLGAGKTTLAQGIAGALRVREHVQSPTFTLVNEHRIQTATGVPGRLYHLDLYRLEGEDDLDSIGFTDYTQPADGITLIEWPERAAMALPERYLLIELTAAGPDRRLIRLSGHPAGDWERLNVPSRG